MANARVKTNVETQVKLVCLTVILIHISDVVDYREYICIKYIFLDITVRFMASSKRRQVLLSNAFLKDLEISLLLPLSYLL